MSPATKTAPSEMQVVRNRRDGLATILNFRFGHASPHWLLPTFEAPAAMVEVGRALVKAHCRHLYRKAVHAAASASMEGDRATMLREDMEAEAERLWLAEAAYKSKTPGRYSWAVLAIDGYALYRDVENDEVIHVTRLDGVEPCYSCRGCKREVLATGDAATCGTCGGTGDRPGGTRLPACIGDELRKLSPPKAWGDLPAMPAYSYPDPEYQLAVDEAMFPEF